ncbi:MAG: ATP-dependent DNA helicase [Lachnospiraceae bacterium]|nr:ATP-dependent DNA helicase [Lachnospiraceae bacterium]
MDEVVNVRISVRNLVEFILRSGDIDNRKGTFGEKEAMQEGSRIHRRIQSGMGDGYRAEVPLSIDVSLENDPEPIMEASACDAGRQEGSPEKERCAKEPPLVLTVEGRADGIFTDGGPDEITYIDEIKGIYRDVLSLDAPVTVHLAQAKCYAYMYGSRQGLSFVGVQMTYCNLALEAISHGGRRQEGLPAETHAAKTGHVENLRRFRQIYSMEELEAWFMDLVGQYRKWARLQIDWQKVCQTSIQALAFPYPWRPGQKEVAASVYRTIARRKRLFIQAPTGTGKTLSTIYPAVKAVGEGLAERIFYATAKTITRTVAEEAFAILRKNGLHMKTVTLTAKDKICFLEETECNPDACPYAKGHFDRVNDAVYELLSEKEALDRQTLEEQARKWRVCPFEMELDTALWTDCVICDYNYIFDPRARLKRFFGEGVKGSNLFLIDEAHNLVERGREMFSASLYKEDFLALKKEIQPCSRKLSRALGRCNTWFSEQKRGLAESLVSGGAFMPNEKTASGMASSQVRILKAGTEAGGLGTFPVTLMNLCGLIEEFLEDSGNVKQMEASSHDATGKTEEKLLELYFQVRRFLDTCDRLDDNYVIYTELCADRRFLLRLYCVDISENLRECLERGRSTIFFSATFLPIGYYKSMLSTQKDDYAIYAQPVFDPANRLVLIGTDTSSRYRNRNPREYRKIAEYVLRIMQARQGNYMVFFSSYQMMEEVADQFVWLCEEQDEAVELVRQMPQMDEEEREAFLARFERPHAQGLAGFCVMGGIFGEGIDLREDRLIGAIVAGVGLPQICNEREILRDFYDKRGEDGFFYAYLCPGMSRVLQSAGRVIRTEADKGVILLLDERFAMARYRSMFPVEWGTPGLCTLRTVGEKTAAFWERSDGRTQD